MITFKIYSITLHTQLNVCKKHHFADNANASFPKGKPFKREKRGQFGISSTVNPFDKFRHLNVKNLIN